MKQGSTCIYKTYHNLIIMHQIYLLYQSKGLPWSANSICKSNIIDLRLPNKCTCLDDDLWWCNRVHYPRWRIRYPICCTHFLFVFAILCKQIDWYITIIIIFVIFVLIFHGSTDDHEPYYFPLNNRLNSNQFTHKYLMSLIGFDRLKRNASNVYWFKSNFYLWWIVKLPCIP